MKQYILLEQLFELSWPKRNPLNDSLEYGLAKTVEQDTAFKLLKNSYCDKFNLAGNVQREIQR